MTIESNASAFSALLGATYGYSLPPAAPIARHTGLLGHAPPWAKAVAVGVLFAGIVAALAAAYYRRKLAAWRARLNAYLTAEKAAEIKAQEEAVTGHGSRRGLASSIPADDVPPPLDLARWKEEDYSHMKPYNQHPVHPAFKIVTGLLMISAGAFPLTLGALVWGIVVAEHGVGTATGVGEIIALADTPELLGLGGLLVGAGLELIWRGVKIVSSGLHELREGKK